MREYLATFPALATKTDTPASPLRELTDWRTSRSSMPPPLTIRSATASPPFQASMRSFGSPGTGTSASGVTVPVVGGAVGGHGAAAAPAVAAAPVASGVVAPGTAPAEAAAVVEVVGESLFFFMF